MSQSEQVTGEPLRVGLLGCGVVGSSVVRMLVEGADDLAARVGRPLRLTGIAVRRPGRDRSDLPVDPALFTTDAEAVVADAGREVVGVLGEHAGDRRADDSASEEGDLEGLPRFRLLDLTHCCAPHGPWRAVSDLRNPAVMSIL